MEPAASPFPPPAPPAPSLPPSLPPPSRLTAFEPAAAPVRSGARAGETSSGWRVAVVAIWVGVVIAWSGVWSVSVQLGLSTWWIGPRGQPMPPLVRLVPFVAPAAMVLAALANVRRLVWWGLLAAAGAAVIGVVDLGKVRNLGLVELAIAALAAVATLATSAGTLRSSATNATHNIP